MAALFFVTNSGEWADSSAPLQATLVRQCKASDPVNNQALSADKTLSTLYHIITSLPLRIFSAYFFFLSVGSR